MPKTNYADPFTWPVPGQPINHVVFGDGVVVASGPGTSPEVDPGIITIDFEDRRRQVPAGTFAMVPA